MKMDASSSSASPINGKTATGSITPEQSGKVYVGSGGKKEAELVGLGLSKLIKSQIDELDKAKKYAMDQSIRFVMEKQRQKHQQQQQKVALYSQALALMGRIYVGSINFDVYEEQIRSVFGIYGPIKHVNMSIDPSTGNHKGFCFIEYEVPEAAHLARDSMNGKLLSGRSIKVMPVGRQDSTPQAQPIIDMVMNEARQYSRVYVACVHPDITENDLRSVFMAFGEMTKCQLARHPSGKKHRGFGYIEFKDADSVKDAIEGMNGFDLGGQCLQVGRAVTPPDAVNYMCAGTASSALPAAAAIAAAELTAKIHAQEILGTSKTSPDASPNQNGASPSRERGSSSPTLQQSPTQTNALGRRRGGFGGFASVPPPAIIQSANANQLLALPVSQQGSGGQSLSAASSPSNEATAISAPQLVIPQLGGGLAAMAVPARQTLAEAQTQQEDSSINDFYTTLKDEKFEPPKLVIPTLSTTLPKKQAKSACSQKPKVAAPIALPSTIPDEHKPKKPKKEKAVGLDLLDRIGEKAKAKSDGFDASKKATFAPLARHLAPKDPNAEDDDEEESGPQLAIGGPESWTALAIREEGGVVAKKSTNSIDKKGKKKGDKKNERGKRKGKGRKKPRYSSGPKLNTATKLAAANLAGALSDNLQTQKDEKGEEASLASQEHVQIRGNDARHLLIQKLMRTNRSSVVVLRNMVTPEGVDEYLEDEIREECQRYGRVIDVVIVQEEDIASVKIFVRFAEPTQAETARKAIDGRFFDGRTVSAQAYDQVLFDHDDFTG